MRRVLLIILFLGAQAAFSQTYGRMDFSLTNAQGQAISGATVNVYTQAACGTATTNVQASLYSTATGGSLAQPLYTDGFGHQFAYVLPGCYTVSYFSPFTGTLPYPDQIAQTAPNLSTAGGTITGNLSVTGTVAVSTGVNAQQFSGSQNAGLYQDINSLVSGDVSNPRWSYDPSSNSNNVMTSPSSGSDGVFSDLVWVNMNGAANGEGLLNYHFITPAGTASVTFNVPMQLPSGIGSSTVYIVITKSDGTTNIASQSAVLTSTLTTYSITASVSPATEYQLQMVFNSSPNSTVQAQALVGKVSLALTGSTGVYSGNFVRYEPGPQMFSGNDSWSTQRWFNQTSPFASMRFRTSATSMTLDLYSTEVALLGGTGGVLVYVNGLFYTSANESSGATQNYVVVSLPPGDKLVEIREGNEANPNGPSSLNLVGTWVSAVFLPSVTPAVFVAPQPAERKLVIYGDSICDSGSPTILSLMWPQQLRARFWGSVTNECWSRRSLYEDMGFTAPGTPYALAWKMTQQYPSDIWIEIGLNDYLLNAESAANFGYNYSLLVDQIHRLSPETKIWVQSMIPNATETANTFGNTLPQYRTALQNLTATRPSFTIFVDGTTMGITTAMLVDGTHPGNVGQSIYSNFVINALIFNNIPTPSADPSPVTFWPMLITNPSARFQCALGQTGPFAEFTNSVATGEDVLQINCDGSITNPFSTIVPIPHISSSTVAITGLTNRAILKFDGVGGSIANSLFTETTLPLIVGETTITGIGGSALTPGTCALGTGTVTGAAFGDSVVVNPSLGTDPGDAFFYKGQVYAANSVVVKVCPVIAGTPGALNYTVLVLREPS